MNQQSNINHEIYTIDNVYEALVHSTIPGVFSLVPNQKFYVRSDQWRDCLQVILEKCSAAWILKDK
ncbi:hypothetical protein BDA99DRAFT_449486 [Phascolomyces articulosus]|uniref:Uncharacterized protein n=1 Tax=Phascolomyces articulosus TaxID=60185 RepID=A0AAD5JUS9_9FUNG|nr:hypothetical protein BDA99DRAFT_449486 [Phascolomyces articulosus]